MSSWKAILAAMLIFAAGAACGVLGTRCFAPGKNAPTGAAPGWISQRTEFLRRLTSRLDLNTNQFQRIEGMISDTQRKLRKLWEPIAPEADREMKELRQAIVAELTPDQRQQFQKLQRERQTGGAQNGAWKRRERHGDTNDTHQGENAISRGPERESSSATRQGTNAIPK